MIRNRAGRVLAAVLVAAAAVAVVIVVLAQQVHEPAGEPDEQPPVATPELATAPLTGLPVDDPGALDHPAVAIKVSDVRQAQPQAGVDRADIVFVQPIGVSYTRLAAVFHSDLPDSVGPVRSVRPADAALLGPFAPVLGNTMGAGWVVDYTDGVADWDNQGTLRVRDSAAYVLDPARTRPDHVFAAPATLVELSDRTEPPAPYFRYAAGPGTSSAELSADAGSSLEVPYGGEWSSTWTYDDATARYLRDQPWGPHLMVDGTQISAANVVIIQVDSVVEKLVDGHGAAVPVLQLVDASGPFTALAGGSSVVGTWAKGGVNEPFRFRTESGDELLLSPGNTWVELPALSAAVTTR